MKDTKILVIGAGSIGKRHATNLADLGVEISIHDVNTKSLKEFCNDNPRFTPVFDLETGLKDNDYDAAVICTPNHLHVPIAHKVVDAGIDLFIEKPLSHSFDGVTELLGKVHRQNLICMAGFNLRYEPGLKYLKEHLNPGDVAFARVEFGSYLPFWRPKTDYRKSYSGNKSMGGGIILDDVHEIDYSCWLFGYPKNVMCSSGTFGNLEIDVEDTAEFVLQYQDKLVTIHCDYLQRKYSRNCHICLRNGETIRWEFGDHVIKYGDNDEEIFNYRDQFTINDMYVSEMKEFVRCIERREIPESTLENAAMILRIALEGKEVSIQ